MRAKAWLRQACWHHSCQPFCFPDAPAYSERQHDKPLAPTILEIPADVPQRCNLDPTFQCSPVPLLGQPRNVSCYGKVSRVFPTGARAGWTRRRGWHSISGAGDEGKPLPEHQSQDCQVTQICPANIFTRAQKGANVRADRALAAGATYLPRFIPTAITQSMGDAAP